MSSLMKYELHDIGSLLQVCGGEEVGEKRAR